MDAFQMLLWTVANCQTSNSSVIQRSTPFQASGLQDVIFQEALLFQSQVRSMTDCARQCSISDCCVTFTFQKDQSIGICRGHSIVSMSLNNNFLPAPGSRVFSRADGLKSVSLPTNCVEIIQKGGGCGVHRLTIAQKINVTVYCDGVWTVFQRRQNGSETFFRGWKDYKNGFGNASGEFWLGLESLHLMTQSFCFELRVDLQDWDSNKAYATYSKFTIFSLKNKYSLAYGNYTGGNAGDSLSSNKLKSFSTFDADNDESRENCAGLNLAAWWYSSCIASSLNGLYRNKSATSTTMGITWYTWKMNTLKFSEMKMRPM